MEKNLGISQVSIGKSALFRLASHEPPFSLIASEAASCTCVAAVSAMSPGQPPSLQPQAAGFGGPVSHHGCWGDGKRRQKGGRRRRAMLHLRWLQGHCVGRRQGRDARAMHHRWRRHRRHGDAAGAIMDETGSGCCQPRQGGGEQHAVPLRHAQPLHTDSRASQQRCGVSKDRRLRRWPADLGGHAAVLIHPPRPARPPRATPCRGLLGAEEAAPGNGRHGARVEPLTGKRVRLARGSRGGRMQQPSTRQCTLAAASRGR